MPTAADRDTMQDTINDIEGTLELPWEHPLEGDLPILYRKHPKGHWEFWAGCGGWIMDNSYEPGPQGSTGGAEVSWDDTWAEPTHEDTR